MAINLWELQGKPTNYNPLPTGWGNNIKLPTIQNMDLTVRFKAKSASGSRLRVTDTGGVNISRTFVLKPDFESFEITWFQKQNDAGIFCFYDDTNPTGNGDIIMSDIELVEKSMGVSTINGIDGFLSGKWVIHPTAKVIDDETLEINAPDSAFLESTLTIPCEPSTSYILKVEATSGSGSIVTPLTKALSALPNISGGAFVNFAFTTPADAYFLKLRVMSNKVGTFTVKRPTLQMGDVQYPYSKKTGERMVLPTSDNLLKVDENEWLQGSRNSSNVITAQTVRITSKGIIDLESNKTYYLNANPGYKFAYFLFDGNGVMVSSSAWLTELTKIETGDNIKKITINLARTNDTTINPKDVVLVRPLLYTDFGKNKLPIPGGTIGKNMFYGYEDGYLNSGTFNEKPLSGSNGQRTTLWMVCEPGMKYALSGGDRSSWHFKNANGVIFAGLVGSDFGGVITPPNGAVLMRVYYSSNGTHEYPQIEKNEVTNYEKPVTAPKVAMKIPKKNMVKEDTVIMDATVTANVIHDETIKLEIGKTYTLSAIIPTGVTMQPRKEYTGGVYQNLNGNGSRQSLTFVATHEILVLRKYTVSPIGLVTVSEIQVEEGYQTSFEKYIPVNKKIISSRIGKNKVDSIQKWSGTWLNSTVQRIVDGVRLVLDTSKQSQSAINSNNFTFPIVAGNKYTISFDVRGSREGSFPNYTYIMKGANGGGNKSLSSLFIPVKSEWTRQSLTFIAENTVNDAYLMVGFSTNATTGTTNGDSMDFKNVQFEEGELTEYESYRFKPNLAKR